MKRFLQLLFLIVPLGGCAQLGLGGSDSDGRSELWSAAQDAMAAENFELALRTFEELTRAYPNSLEGRESLFYLGAIQLDPRNSDWDPEPAEERFAEYLALITDGGPRLYRYPEAQVLHEIARQLNLPPDSRVAGLQPGERVVTVEERVVVPGTQSRELASQVAELRSQLAERDARIQQQQEELERIRRTLTGGQQ